MGRHVSNLPENVRQACASILAAGRRRVVLLRVGDDPSNVQDARGVLDHVLQARIAYRQRHLGKDDLNTIASVHALAAYYIAQCRYELASPLCEQVFEAYHDKLGPHHSLTLTSASDLAGICQGQGNSDEAFERYSDILKHRETLLGPDHRDTLETVSRIANLTLARGMCSEAAQLSLRVLSGYEAVLCPEHPRICRSLYDL